MRACPINHRSRDVTEVEGKRECLMAVQDNDRAEGLESVSDPIEDEASAPLAVMSEDGDTTLGRRHPKWLVPVIIAVVAVVLVVSGLVCWRLVESHRHDSALDSCNRAVKTLHEKTGSDQLASYRDAADVNAGQVKDTSTVLAMDSSSQ